MKYIATSKQDLAVLAAFLCIFLTLGIRAENSCDCKSPPGGRIRCEDNQVAICRISQDGTVNGTCITPPGSAGSGEELRAWLLGLLLNRPVTKEEVRQPNYRQMLTQGRLQAPNGDTVTFKLPQGR
jgi:hypothetical protein